MLLAITDIFKNGSFILFNSNAINIIKNAYGEKSEQGDFIEGMVSRKKQMLPPIMNTIN